jgi:DtxR family Mn-dependent transcriptional regulator
MVNHKNNDVNLKVIKNIMSESEEMYLVTIAMLNEAGAPEPVPLSQVAGELQVQPVSANQMVHKLELAGLVNYKPYKGVALTSEGWHQACQILRHRRLWEVFLVERLHFSLSEADQLACRLEHIFPSEAAERLADYLGKPVVSPGGRQIPNAQSDFRAEPGLSLSQLQIGERGRVIHIQADSATRGFMVAEGLSPDAQIDITAIGSGGSRLIRTGKGHTLNLAEELSNLIRVEKLPTDE